MTMMFGEHGYLDGDENDNDDDAENGNDDHDSFEGDGGENGDGDENDDDGENDDENENDDLAESGFDFSKKRCRLDQITGAGQVDNYLMFQI